MGRTAADLGLLGAFSGETLLSTLNDGTGVTNGTFKIQYGSVDDLGVFNDNANTITIDIEFAETLSDVKNAIEKASNNDIFVSFGNSNRIELTLASNDDKQRIEISESSGSSDVANSLGLMHSSIVMGRELKDGSQNILNASTKLSELGKNNYTYETLVIEVSGDREVIVDLSTALTIGDVISKINSSTVAENGDPVNIQADIVNGRYLSISSINGNTVEVISSANISKTMAEKYSLDTLSTALSGINNNDTLVITDGVHTQSISLGAGTSPPTDYNQIITDITTANNTNPNFHFTAEVNATNDGIIINSNDSFSATLNPAGGGAAVTVSATDLGNVLETTYIDSNRSTNNGMAELLGLNLNPLTIGEAHFISTDLKPMHQAENFFSALTTLRDQFDSNLSNQSIASNTLVRLENLKDKLLLARGDAGGRIVRFNSLTTRYEDESVKIQTLYGSKVEVDFLEVTQQYLQQQQVYEAGLSVTSRIVGNSLFNYL
jgi:flagellin-like hook-associated protein FlgL